MPNATGDVKQTPTSLGTNAVDYDSSLQLFHTPRVCFYRGEAMS